MTILITLLIVSFVAVSIWIFREEINGGIDSHIERVKKRKAAKERKRLQEIEQTRQAIEKTFIASVPNRNQNLYSSIMVSGVVDARTLEQFREAPAEDPMWMSVRTIPYGKLLNGHDIRPATAASKPKEKKKEKEQRNINFRRV